jgi:hypothetical protein
MSVKPCLGASSGSAASPRRSNAPAAFAGEHPVTASPGFSERQCEVAAETLFQCGDQAGARCCFFGLCHGLLRSAAIMGIVIERLQSLPEQPPEDFSLGLFYPLDALVYSFRSA